VDQEKTTTGVWHTEKNKIPTVGKGLQSTTYECLWTLWWISRNEYGTDLSPLSFTRF